MNIFLDLLAKFESDFKTRNHSQEYSFENVFRDVTYEKISINENYTWLLNYDLGIFSYEQLINLLFLKNIVDYRGIIDINIEQHSLQTLEEKELYKNPSKFHVQYKFHLPYEVQQNHDKFRMIKEICYIEIVSIKSIKKDIELNSSLPTS